MAWWHVSKPSDLRLLMPACCCRESYIVVWTSWHEGFEQFISRVSTSQNEICIAKYRFVSKKLMGCCLVVYDFSGFYSLCSGSVSGRGSAFSLRVWVRLWFEQIHHLVSHQRRRYRSNKDENSMLIKGSNQASEFYCISIRIHAIYLLWTSRFIRHVRESARTA